MYQCLQLNVAQRDRSIQSRHCSHSPKLDFIQSTEIKFLHSSIVQSKNWQKLFFTYQKQASRYVKRRVKGDKCRPNISYFFSEEKNIRLLSLTYFNFTKFLSARIYGYNKRFGLSINGTKVIIIKVISWQENLDLSRTD